MNGDWYYNKLEQINIQAKKKLLNYLTKLSNNDLFFSTYLLLYLSSQTMMYFSLHICFYIKHISFM